MSNQRTSSTGCTTVKTCTPAKSLGGTSLWVMHVVLQMVISAGHAHRCTLTTPCACRLRELIWSSSPLVMQCARVKKAFAAFTVVRWLHWILAAVTTSGSVLSQAGGGADHPTPVATAMVHTAAASSSRFALHCPAGITVHAWRWRAVCLACEHQQQQADAAIGGASTAAGRGPHQRLTNLCRDVAAGACNSTTTTGATAAASLPAATAATAAS